MNTTQNQTINTNETIGTNTNVTIPVEQMVQEINVSVRDSNRQIVTRYEIWWDAGLCGGASDQILYHTLEEASIRLSHICEVEGWTWDAPNRRSVEVDLCDTPRAYITEYVIPGEIYNLMSYYINLLETLEEMMTPEQIRDYGKYPEDMKLSKDILVEDIRRVYYAFHQWHYREDGWAQEMIKHSHE